MTPLELKEKLVQGEGPCVEFKRCGNQPESDVFETICSFSNRNGGSLFLGVLDTGEVVGLSAKALPSIKRNIVNVTNNEAVFSPSVTVEFEEIAIEGKTVLRVWVPMSSTIHRFKKVVFDRKEDADVKVETADALAAMYLRKQNIYTEQRIYPFLTDSDLLLERMGDFRRRAYIKHADHPWKQMSDREILRSMKLYSLDYATGEQGYTMAAALLLGRDDVIASICPAYKTDVIVRIDDTQRYDDRFCTSTNLVDAHAQLCDYITRYLPDRFNLDGMQATSPRDTIVREVVTNSLIHREYVSALPARIIIESERLTAENASRAAFQGPLDPQTTYPMPKNPVIAKFFNQIGLAEELGSGVPTLYRSSRAYTGKEPTLIEGDVFRAVIPLDLHKAGETQAYASTTEEELQTVETSVDDKGRATKTPSSRDEQLLDAARQILATQQSFTASEIASALGLNLRTVQRELSSLVEKDLLASEGKTRGKRYLLP